VITNQRRPAREKPREPSKPGKPPVALTSTGTKISLQLATRSLKADTKSEREADAAAHALAPGQGGSSPATGPFGIILEDDAALGPGQIHRSDFIDRISAEIDRGANNELSAIGRTTRDCPYLAKWLDFYRSRSAGHLERAIQHYASPGRPDLAGLNEAVLNRVRQAVQAWIRSGGREVQAPEGVAHLGENDRVLQSSASGSSIQRQAIDGAGDSPLSSHNPEAVRAQLSPGHGLDGGIRSRMEQGFGRAFGDVRVHTDQRAAQLARSLSASAFTIGSDIAFASGQYRPGNPAGDLLIAHELAHVTQQCGSGLQPLRVDNDPAEQPLEQEAILAAARAVFQIHDRAHEQYWPSVRPATGRGLRLSRCDSTQAPTNLTSVAAKAKWIKQTMQSSMSDKGRAIADLLMTLSMPEFIDIQSRLDMAAVLDQLDTWNAVRVGTLGPVRAGRDRLNRLRADLIFQATREGTMPEAEIIAHWIFNNMYGNDIRDVLMLLAADQHLYNTVDEMPAVLELLRSRGIDRREFQDRDWKVGDVGRALKNFTDRFLGSSPAQKGWSGAKWSSRILDMPQAYQDAMWQVWMAIANETLTPRNIVLGELDYLAFNIPSSVIGLATGTVSGIKQLARGHVEAGTEQLTGSVIFVLTLALGVRAFRRSARMAAMLEMTPEGGAALARLRASIGQKGIDRVARYVQADSQAAFLVREQGLAGIEALAKAEGKVAAARQLIGSNVARLGSLLSADTLAPLGFETQQALATLPDATLRTLAGADAATLDSLAQMLRESSPALRGTLTKLAESNPSAFGELLRNQGAAAINALRTGPFASLEELASAARKSTERVSVPVVRDGKVLYESIDPAHPPEGWKFHDTVTRKGGLVTIKTDVTDPKGATGYFIRSFNPATGELKMLEAYLRAEEGKPEIAGQVKGGVELRKGIGTPTQAYATLRQLRMQGVTMGSLRRIVMNQIENFKTICRLEWMRRNSPGRSLNQLIVDTESVQYAQTTAEQAGARISGARVVGGGTQPIGRLMQKYEAEAAKSGPAAVERVRAEHDAILQKYGFTRETRMLTKFNIEIDLGPIQEPPAP
jgi:hypothetical protein